MKASPPANAAQLQAGNATAISRPRTSCGAVPNGETPPLPTLQPPLHRSPHLQSRFPGASKSVIVLISSGKRPFLSFVVSSMQCFGGSWFFKQAIGSQRSGMLLLRWGLCMRNLSSEMGLMSTMARHVLRSSSI